MSESLESDDLKIVLQYLLVEINRYRDWPIKILTFTSALHFAINGAFLLKAVTITPLARIAITIFIGTLWFWTIAVFRHCHLSYLGSRNIQSSIQRKIGLNKDSIILKSTTNRCFRANGLNIPVSVFVTDGLVGGFMLFTQLALRDF